MSQNSERKLSICLHKFSGTNCKKCGVYLHTQNGVVKSNLYDSYLNCSAKSYICHIRKRQNQIIQTKQTSDGVWTIVQSICEKFEYTFQTMVLGLYIFFKTKARNDKDDKFWASVCLLVASKAIELDKRVPYVNRYQKHAQKNFCQSQYQQAERTVIQNMDFNLQITTFVTFMNFYLTNGVFFANDKLVQSDIINMQDQAIQKSKQMAKNYNFVGYEPEMLALSLIKQVRSKHRLQPWPKQLQILTNYKAEQIHVIEKNNILKPICILSTKAKQKLSGISNHSYLISMQNSLQILDNKPKLVRRKNESMIKNSVKQNSFKPQPQVHLSLLANVRRQAFSASKYSMQNNLQINGCSYNPSEKLISLGNFQSKRA